jgi:hypothetical protein
MDKMSELGWKFVNDLARASQRLNAEKPELENTNQSINQGLNDDTSMDRGDKQ